MEPTFNGRKEYEMEIKTKEDIIALSEAMDKLKERAIEVAGYLGCIGGSWEFESMDIGKDNICVSAYDICYDLHDTQSVTFPMECIFDEEFLKDYKIRKDEEKRLYKEQKFLEEQQKKESKERAEYERLKAKYD